VRHDPEVHLAAIETRIAWVLEHPHMSDWLKKALQSALSADPITLQNDVEVLSSLLKPRSAARIAFEESVQRAE
jgi:hypothetical protein